MSIVWSAQIHEWARFGSEIYKKKKKKKKKLHNSENRSCHGNGEKNQHFFYICVH